MHSQSKSFPNRFSMNTKSIMSFSVITWFQYQVFARPFLTVTKKPYGTLIRNCSDELYSCISFRKKDGWALQKTLPGDRAILIFFGICSTMHKTKDFFIP